MLGAPGGPEIENKNSILSDIDRVLGVSKPPAIEFIFVEPYPSTILYLFSYFFFSFVYRIVHNSGTDNYNEIFMHYK